MDNMSLETIEKMANCCMVMGHSTDPQEIMEASKVLQIEGFTMEEAIARAEEHKKWE